MVGKTTLGRIVAKSKGFEFIDTDDHIERKHSMSIKEIFEKKGEKFFRLEEKIEILKLLKKKKCVISLGGGSFMNKIIRDEILKNGVSIWLDTNISILNKRSKWSAKRPLLDKKNSFAKIKKLYSERRNFYKLSNYKIICDKLSKKEITKKILKLYKKE